VEPAGDLEGLPLRPCRWCVRGEVAGGGEQRERRVVGRREQLMLARGRLDTLDGVEVTVLAGERGADGTDEPGFRSGSSGAGNWLCFANLCPCCHRCHFRQQFA
jgi:hypothetical protein